MPKSPLTDKMKDRAPKFGDEGEPEESARGTAAGPDDGAGGDPGSMPDDPSGGPPMPGGAPTPGGMDPTMAKAIDDMGDVLGIGPEDRTDFANALSAFVSSAMAQSMGPEPDADDMGGGPPPPMPPPGAGPEEEEPQ